MQYELYSKPKNNKKRNIITGNIDNNSNKNNNCGIKLTR